MLPVLATISNKISSVRQVETNRTFNLLKDEISFDIVAENGNNVETTFDFVEKTNYTINAFDIVASVDGALLSLRTTSY